MDVPVFQSGITFRKKPPALALAGNPVRFDVLGTTCKDSTAGTKTSFSFKVSGTDETAGHVMSFDFLDFGIAFMTSATPDDSGTKIHAATSGQGYSAWAAILYGDFLANYYLTKLFNIVLLSDSGTSRIIQFTAKEAGIKANFTFDNVNVSGVAQDAYTAGVDTVVYDDYAIVSSLFDEDGILLSEDLLPGIPGEWEVDPQPAWLINRAVFDFSEILESYLESRYFDPRFAWPQEPSHLILGHSDFLLKYLVSFAEKFGAVVRKLFFDSEYRYVIGGGLNRESLAALNSLETDYFSQTDINMVFLTWGPLQKITGKDTPEVLWWLAAPDSGPGECKLSVEVHYSNATSYSFTTSLVAYTAASVLEVLCGYKALALEDIDPTKIVSFWNVWLVDDGGTILTEARKFELDPLYCDHERHFIFRNSFACYDAMRFSGKSIKDLNYDRAMGSVITDEDDVFTNPPMRAFDLQESQSMKTSSGFISADTKNYLREMLLSKEVYEVVDDCLFPVVITSSKLQAFFDDAVTLYSLDIEYQRAYTDKFFSAEYTASPSPIVTNALTADTTEVTADSVDITADQITY